MEREIKGDPRRVPLVWRNMTDAKGSAVWAEAGRDRCILESGAKSQ